MNVLRAIDVPDEYENVANNESEMATQFIDSSDDNINVKRTKTVENINISTHITDTSIVLSRN